MVFGEIERFPNSTWKFINDSGTGLIWTAAPTVNSKKYIAHQYSILTIVCADPRGRFGHSLVRSDSNEIFVFGGRTEYEGSGFSITYDELWTVR